MRNSFTTKKQQNRPGQKTRILSMAVILSLMLTMIPVNGAFAAEQDRFADPANANHWGRSDLRAYLNNGLATVAADGTVSTKNYGLDSTTEAYASNNASGYAAEFSAAEYALVQPFTYSTNILNGDEVSTYTTTDKFWLPSANHKTGQNQIISWGSEDISSDSQYTETTKTDKQRIIPVSYWSERTSMLRSPNSSGDSVLTAVRGDSVKNSTVDTGQALAAACKIDLSSVNFASTASAASIIADVNTGTGAAKKTENAKKIEISGWSDFGKKTAVGSGDYGMYLKTSSDSSFEASSLSLRDRTLTVDYTGGVAGQYVVVHVFREDSLTDGITNYVAAKELAEGKTSETMSATIDVSQWGLNNFDGYTIKVWMEDGSGSLAKATEPVTFAGTNTGGSPLSDTDTSEKNTRVFAMKADLQTSWGDLSSLSDDDYKKVISGSNASANSHVMGTNPTNQKLYFGSRQFWIAGRETAANGGEISKDGNIITLYQAKPDANEPVAFNASLADYLGTPAAGDFAFTAPGSLTSDGTAKEATVTSDKTGMGEITIKYYKADGTTPAAGTDATAAPTEAGKYIVKIDVSEGSLYDAATDLSDADWTFTIEPASSTEPAGGDSDKDSGSGSSGNASSPDNSSSSGNPEKSPETGDEMSYYTMLGLGVLMMLALGFLPNVIRNRKKLEE